MTLQWLKTARDTQYSAHKNGRLKHIWTGGSARGIFRLYLYVFDCCVSQVHGYYRVGALARSLKSVETAVSRVSCFWDVWTGEVA